MIALSANDVWPRLLEKVLTPGKSVVTRGQSVIESLAVTSVIDMNFPVITNHRRNTPGYLHFLAAEAHWIISGSGRLDNIQEAAPSLGKFSDNGLYMQGAYGPQFIQQLQYIFESFSADKFTRQAIVQIWRPSPRPSKDIPCTLSLQFLYRERKLHCAATMRSSDLWLGYPFDVFSFSMMTAYVLLHLKIRDHLPADTDLGTLWLTAGSQHIYGRNLPQAEVAISSSYWDYLAMCIYDFKHPDELLSHLGLLAQARYDQLTHKFLSEMRHHR